MYSYCEKTINFFFLKQGRIPGYMYIPIKKSLVYMLLMLDLTPDMPNVDELNCRED